MAGKLRERAEPAYQILGRMIGALSLARHGKFDLAEKELSWVGGFLISTGSVPTAAWDYRDLQPLAREIQGIPPAARLLFDVLTGTIPLQEFMEAWKQLGSVV